MRRPPLRVQVALAFTATTAVLLAILGVVVYHALEDSLEDQARTRLTTQLEALRRLDPAEQPAAVSATAPPVFAQLLTGSGRVVAASPDVPAAVLSRRELAAAGQRRELEVGVPLAGKAEPEQALLVVEADGGRVLVVGTSREDLVDTLQTMLTTLLLGCAGALVLAAGLGYVLAGTALRPVDRMRRQAARISADRSDERLPVPPGRDEVHRLGTTLNAMLDRLEEGLARERRFVAEAGHELRTPLALLRMEIDLALAAHRSEEELVAALRSAGEEVDRLTRLSEDLLRLATDGSARTTGRLDVGELLAAAADRARPAFATAGRVLHVEVDGTPAVDGDRDQLDRALTNVIDNALRHGGGDVWLAAAADSATVRLEVRDAGAGAALPDRPLAPFTRSSTARTVTGNGLGLAIVRSIVEAHGGAILLDSSAEGTAVTLTLPLARPSAT